MARYTVTLHADRALFPALLSNGNLVAQGDEPGGRHFARWVDPFPKPCYLFAMVAAKLDVLDDRFTTQSGREVAAGRSTSSRASSTSAASRWIR
jgi:aminopeptidase N